MRGMLRATVLALAALAVWSSGGDAEAADVGACSFLTNAEVEGITGRRMYTDPEEMQLSGGSVCGYDVAQVILFSGEGSGERLEALLESFGHDKDERHPVPGLGEGAYVIYPEPRNQYQDRGPFLVAKVGPHTVAVSVAAEEGKPAESVLPEAVRLAKAVMDKLR